MNDLAFISNVDFAPRSNNLLIIICIYNNINKSDVCGLSFYKTLLVVIFRNMAHNMITNLKSDSFVEFVHIEVM